MKTFDNILALLLPFDSKTTIEHTSSGVATTIVIPAIPDNFTPGLYPTIPQSLHSTLNALVIANNEFLTCNPDSIPNQQLRNPLAQAIGMLYEPNN